MELDCFSLLFTTLLGGSVFVFWCLRNFNEWYYVGRLDRETKSHLPPGDMGWPLVGNLLTFLRAFKSQDPDSFIYDLLSRYGKTGMYKTYLFGGPSVIVCSPETCKKILANEEQFKPGYPKATVALTSGRRGLHNVSKAEHKRLRKLTTDPINGHHSLSLYVHYIEETVVDSLRELASMETPTELLTETRKIAFKIITHIFMGAHSNSNIVASMHNLFAVLSAGMKSQPINIPGFIYHKALKARKKLAKMLELVLEDKRNTMENNKEVANEKKDMMKLLMDVKDEDGRRLEDEEIIDLLLGFLLAGHESSSHVILWAVVYLLQHPHVLTKAKEEQEEIMKRRPATQKGLNLKEIKQMEYLVKVIDETLRRTTISLANFREAIVDVHMNGYIIPKGWKALVWNRGIHMDPENHPNPHEFNPERWDEEKTKAAFLPFGAGSMLCPGSDLAKLEVTIFLHHFLLHYKIEALNPQAPVKYLPLPSPADNFLVRIVKLS